MGIPAGSDASQSGNHRRTGTYWTVLGLVVALFGLLLVDQLGTAMGYPRTLPRTITIKWTITAILIGIVLYGEGRSIRSIGIRRPDRWDLASAVGLTIVGFVTLAATFAILPLLGFGPTDATPNSAASSGFPLLLLAVVVNPLTSGVTEEIMFRGYAIERIEAWTASTWIAGLVTVSAFVLVHGTTYSIGEVLGILPLAVVLTLGYLWRRNVFVVVFAHWSINSIGAIATAFG